MQKTMHPDSALSWADIQLFLAAARARSGSQAARRLELDQATVSRRLRALERTLGQSLFKRGPYGHALTDAGRTMLAQAEAMEAAALGIQSRLSEDRAALGGTLRIAGPEAFLCSYLAPRLGALRRAHPALELQLVPMPHLMSVSRREIDIAITVNEVPEGRAVTRKLTDYTLGLFAAAPYLAEHGSPSSVSQLTNHALVGYIDDLIVMRALDYLDEIHPGLRPALQSASILAQRAMTGAGLGIGMLPHYLTAECPEFVSILPEQVRLTRSYWIVAHADTKDLPIHRTVIDYIVQQVNMDRSYFAPPADRVI